MYSKDRKNDYLEVAWVRNWGEGGSGEKLLWLAFPPSFTWEGSSGSGESVTRNFEMVWFQWRLPFNTFTIQGRITRCWEFFDLMISFPDWNPSEVARDESKVTLATTVGFIVDDATWKYFDQWKIKINWFVLKL